MAYYQAVTPDDGGWGWPDARDIAEPLRPVVSAWRQARQHVLRAVSDVPEEHLWVRIGEDVMAVGNVLLHLAGSEHQWIAVKIGGRPLNRDRDREFAMRGGPLLSELLDAWRTVAAESDVVLQALTGQDARERRSPDGLSVQFILHYTNQHVCVHLGQLVAVREYLSPGYRLY